MDQDYQVLFESNPHPMWVYDLASLAFLAVNGAAVAHYGYSREEYLAMTIRDIRPPEDGPALEQNLASAPHGFEAAGSWRHRKKNGEIIEVEITSHTLEPDGRRARLVLAVDVTERKRAERVLRQNEERHRALFEATETVVWLTTPAGDVVFATDKWNQITGQTDEERAGWGWLEAIHLDDRGPTTQNWLNSLATKTVHMNEFRVRTRDEIRRVLRAGGLGIGEQKFMVDADSRALAIVAELAQEFGVPVLLHFQFGRYNTSFERFPRILEKFPAVNFIGHAQTWWANIDAQADQPVLYPKGPVTPGGLTDKYLADYTNLFGDMSAGSGLNAMQRDEEHARAFIARHADKLMFGSDCDDAIGTGEKCSGSQMLATIRRLAPSKEIERKLLFGNAKRVLKLPV